MPPFGGNMENSIYISEITFRNCQSLKNISYTLTPGLNVVMGLNSAGKSVLFKALKMAVGSELFKGANLKHLISYGQQSAAAIFSFSDGSSGGFIADYKTVIYLYREKETDGYQKLSKPHPEFIMRMSIIIDEKTKFILNILDADQELLFVNSKESTNFSMLSLISDNEQLDSLMPCLEEKFSNTKDYLSRVNYIHDMIESKLSVMEKVNTFNIKQKISISESILPLIQNLFHLYDLINKISFVDEVDFVFCDKAMNLFQYFKLLTDLISKVCPINDIDFGYVSFLLQELHDVLGVKEKLVEYYDSILLLQKLQKDMDLIATTMQQDTYCVDCSVKGKVYFFENGCIPVDEVKVDEGLSGNF